MVKFWEERLANRIKERKKLIKRFESMGDGDNTVKYKQLLKEAERQYELEWKNK